MKVLREGNPNHYKQTYKGSVTCIWCASQLEYGYDDIKLSVFSWMTRRPVETKGNELALYTEEDFMPPEFIVVCPVCSHKLSVKVESPEFAMEIYHRFTSMDIYPK